MRPPLPLPRDDAFRVPGMLLLRTGDDDAVWNDVLTRMGELPGMQGPPGQESVAEAGAPTPLRRRLIVAHDSAWRGATAEEIGTALKASGIWVPDLVLLTDKRTTLRTEARPLLAFGIDDGNIVDFWITPRQAAMTYLVLHRPNASFDIQMFAERAPNDLEWEFEKGEEGEESHGSYDAYVEAHHCQPAGLALETSSTPPRYTRPARELPLLGQEIDLLVRTDFTDDAAWAALVEAVSHPGYNGAGQDYSDDIRFVDDPAFAGATPEQVMAQVLPGPDDEDFFADVVLIADATTLHHPQQRVLVVPMTEDIGLTFRVDADQAGIMLPNLALANQEIEDYRDDDEADL